MDLYSYTITHDTGFAPNPFWGFCTLANCKPRIRKRAKTGDWVVGLSQKKYGHKVVYAMRIEEILQYAEYFTDTRFKSKIPDLSKPQVVYKCGDNIYEPRETGGFRQLPSSHSDKKDRAKENPDTKEHDLSGKNVLISQNFCYFGSQGPELPADLKDLVVARGYKRNFSEEIKERFLRFIKTKQEGVLGPPRMWGKEDESWRQEIK